MAQIIVKNNLMKILTENVNARMVTMMMVKIIYVSNAPYFGLFKLVLKKLYLF